MAPYAALFSLKSLALTSIVLRFGITDPPADEFYSAFTAILRDIGIAGLASAALTTTILEGWQTFMIISATFLKPRERRIREEARAEGFEEGYAEGIELGRAEARAAIEKGQAEIRAAIAEGRLQEIDLGHSEVARAALIAETIELERAAWIAWRERSELARAKGEEPPPPPFYRASIEKTIELERAAWIAWYERSELARAKGEEPPPPPFYRATNGRSG